MDNSRPKCSSYSSPGNLKKKKNDNRKQHPSNVDEKKQLYIKKKRGLQRLRDQFDQDSQTPENVRSLFVVRDIL